MIKKRERLREGKKFSAADLIRDELKQKHKIGLEDTEYGTVWYRIRDLPANDEG
jgi:cysteinyl-tRNA synthetase